jgi:hypothetical protein
VQQSIMYRYNLVKSKAALMEARLKDMNSLMKVKNPSLMQQAQRHGSQANYQHQVARGEAIHYTQLMPPNVRR